MVDLPLHVGPGLCLCLVLVGERQDWYRTVLLVVVVSDCMPSPGQGGQMALYQHPPYDPASIHNCHTPHALHTTHPLGQWVAQLAS